MAKSAPSRLANLRELVATVQLSFQVQAEITAILEDYEMRIYSLEEDRRRLLADYKVLSDKNRSLETRYSEVLYRLSELNNKK